MTTYFNGLPQTLHGTRSRLLIPLRCRHPTQSLTSTSTIFSSVLSSSTTSIRSAYTPCSSSERSHARHFPSSRCSCSTCMKCPEHKDRPTHAMSATLTKQIVTSQHHYHHVKLDSIECSQVKPRSIKTYPIQPLKASLLLITCQLYEQVTTTRTFTDITLCSKKHFCYLLTTSTLLLNQETPSTSDLKPSTLLSRHHHH